LGKGERLRGLHGELGLGPLEELPRDGVDQAFDLGADLAQTLAVAAGTLPALGSLRALLELAPVHGLGGLDPLVFGVDGGDGGELTHLAPGESTLHEGVVDLPQIQQRAADSDQRLRLAEAELQALERVLDRARVAEELVLAAAVELS